MGPEETLQALSASVAAGAQVLELDVHGSADGVPVCIHDDTLDRTTSGTGPVSALPLAQLQALDAGHHDPDWRGRGARIPTLAEVLAAFPDMPFVLEIKQTEPPITDTVLEVIAGAGATERVIVASFDADVLAAVRAAPDGPVTSFAAGEVVDFLWIDDDDPWRAPAPFMQIPPSFAGMDLVSPDLLARAERLGVGVQVWTITDEDEMRALVERGVHGIMTPDPATLARVLGGGEPPR